MTDVMAKAQWRRMREEDVARANEVGNAIHVDFFEEEAVFQNRFALYPAGCFVLTAGDEIVGYGISHPWRLDSIPTLNTVIEKLPDNASTYYIHDIAILPAYRSGGNAAHVVRLMAGQAEHDGFATMALVAVNGSRGYWERHGFVVRSLPALEEKLQTYSDVALYMVRVG